ncbi:MAG: hypothetical protein AAF515_07940 [Pseudomonadota bacterium]
MNQTPLDELMARLRGGLDELLGQTGPQGLPADALQRLEARFAPLVDAALAPFQVLRREEFDGHIAQLERLEAEVSRLQDRVAELETRD